MESDSTLINSNTPVSSPNNSMPPTPNSVENGSSSSSSCYGQNNSSNKSNKSNLKLITSTPMTIQNSTNNTSNSDGVSSTRRRHYSSASSSAEDEPIDVVSNNNGVYNSSRLISHKSSAKKLHTSSSSSSSNYATAGNQTTNIKSPLNTSVNDKFSNQSNLNNSSSTTILHSPSSNSSSINLLDSKHSQDSAAVIFANLDADSAAGKKFKSFLIEDILSQQQKQKKQQQQKLFLLQQQQLFLLHQQQLSKNLISTLPLSPNHVSSSNVNNNNNINNLNNNNDPMNAAAAAAAAALANNGPLSAAMAAYSSIVRPWDLSNGCTNTNALSLPTTANLAYLASQNQPHNLHVLNNGNQATSQPTSRPAVSSPALLATCQALSKQTNTLSNTSLLDAQQQSSLLKNQIVQQNNCLPTTTSPNTTNETNFLLGVSSSLNSANKLNVHQLQQLSQLNHFGLGQTYSPHLSAAAAAGFPSLTHLNSSFFASMNNSNLFPGLSGVALPSNVNQSFSAAAAAAAAAALNAALKSETTSNNLHNLNHLNNSNNLHLDSKICNTTNHLNLNVATSSNSKMRFKNENGKRLNVENLDEDELEDLERDDLLNEEDEDCDEKCSINSSNNGASKSKINASNNGESPLSALYELANKNFEIMKTEKNAESNGERMNTMFTNNGQNSKKKRKSRTAFTNRQIFELEKRFIMQKYLTPSDRDELADFLELTGAQVITWFQNRRAKLKRENEEMSKDVQTAKMVAQVQAQSLYYNKALFENKMGSMYDNIELYKAAKLHLMPPLPSKNL